MTLFISHSLLPDFRAWISMKQSVTWPRSVAQPAANLIRHHGGRDSRTDLRFKWCWIQHTSQSAILQGQGAKIAPNSGIPGSNAKISGKTRRPIAKTSHSSFNLLVALGCKELRVYQVMGEAGGTSVSLKRFSDNIENRTTHAPRHLSLRENVVPVHDSSIIIVSPDT